MLLIGHSQSIRLCTIFVANQEAATTRYAKTLGETYSTYIYDGNHVVAAFNRATSADVSVHRGLRQGCRLSPFLYMLYTSGMEKALKKRELISLNNT